MIFQSVFELVSLLVVLAGFAALVAAGAVGALETAIYLVLLGLGWFAGPFKIRRLWYLLPAVLLAGLVIAEFLFGEMFIRSAVHLLMGLSLFKSATRQRDGDYLVLYFLSFAFLLVASVFTLSISYLAFLVLFVFLGVLALVLFESREGFQENPTAPFSLRAYLQVTLVITAATAVLSVPFFLAVPRGALGLLDTEGGRVSGFSTSVRLGELGGLLLNPQVVMRVTVNRPEAEIGSGLRWRGIALDQFDGRNWTNTRWTLRQFRPDEAGRYLVAVRRRQVERMLQQAIYMEPFSEVLFGAPSLIQLSGFLEHRIQLVIDGNDSLRIRPLPSEPLRYFVFSDLESRAERIRRIDWDLGIPEDIQNGYLGLPPLRPEVGELARSVAGNAQNSLEQALLLEAFLKRSYRYTLDNPSGLADDPLYDYLFESKAGHCEYSATALAILLRVLGVPTRLVNGFQRGEFNEWGEYFIVRQSDAHSWVEVFLPGAGWVEFDPTPVASRGSGGFLWTSASHFLDSLDVLWAEIVTFDRFKQLGFFQSVRRGLQSGWGRTAERLHRVLEPGRFDPSGWTREIWSRRWTMAAFLIVGAALLVAIFIRGRLRLLWKRYILRRSSGVVVQEFFRELTEILERGGFVRTPGETPLEYCGRAGVALGSGIPVDIATAYYLARFGGREPDSTTLDLMYRELKRLTSLIRGHVREPGA